MFSWQASQHVHEYVCQDGEFVEAYLRFSIVLTIYCSVCVIDDTPTTLPIGLDVSISMCKWAVTLSGIPLHALKLPMS